MLVSTVLNDHLNKLSLLEENQEKSINNKILFDNDRCHSLTGLKSDQFSILLQSIDGDWPYSISKRDSLFMFLARLRLGIKKDKINYSC